jgi:hypothetical protein
LLLQSENFASASWNAGTATRTSDQIAAPDGASTADLITSIDGNFGGKLSQSLSFAATTYTASVFVKKGNWRYIGITWAGIANSGRVASFDFDTETVSANGVPSATIGFQKLSSGWYRIFLTLPTTAVTGTFDIWMTTSTGAAVGPIGSGQTVYTWGAQLEAGAFPTSYIPTTTGTLARGADVCSITGGDFTSFYNTPEGTLFAGVTPQSVAQAAVVVGVNTATFLNSHFIYKSDSTANVAGLRWVGASQAAPAIPSTTDVATTFAKIAYAYKSGSFAMAYNNILAGTSSFTVISNPTAMRIGARDGGLAINGHISEVKYFKKRLPNEKIQALTV